MTRIHLDHQAATPVAPEVLAAMQPWFIEKFGNPSSLHQTGLEARQAIEQSRAQVARFLHAPSPESILFTGSGTEAVNLAVKGAAWATRRRGHHLVVSAIEHPAVLRSVEFLMTQGFTCTRVPVDPLGLVDPARIRAALTDQTILICLHHANHEIGTIEPVKEVGALAQEAGIPLFVDATASAGWLDLDVETLGASLLAFAPHRFGGPKGVGVLFRRPSASLTPLVHGGLQEGGRHAGTENVAAIVGAGIACDLAARQFSDWAQQTSVWQRQLLDAIRATVTGVHLHGPEPGPQRLPHSLNLSFEGVEGEGLLLSLDLQGVAVASGSACLARSARIPPVLAALGLDPALVRGNILLSLGREHTGEQIDRAVAALTRTVARLRELSPSTENVIRPPAPPQPIA